MAVEFAFYSSLNGDRMYFAGDFLNYFASLVADGIVANIGSSLAVAPAKNMTVKVQNGVIFDGGYMARVFDDGEEIDLANADGALTRIDRIVMRNAKAQSERWFRPVYVKGTASASPLPPAPVRDGSTTDYVLATITVPRGTTAITAAMIKDERQDRALCGLTFGLGQTLDTTSLFNQFWGILNDATKSFNVWFDGVKATLGDDAAGNLMNMVNAAIAEMARLDKAKAEKTALAATDAAVAKAQAAAEMAQNTANRVYGGKLYDHSQTFTASGNWVCPAGVSFAAAWIADGAQGGGGAGIYGDASAVGGQGASGKWGMAEGITVVPGQSYAVIVGAGGAGGATPYCPPPSNSRASYSTTSQGTMGGTSSAFGKNLLNSKVLGQYSATDGYGHYYTVRWNSEGTGTWTERYEFGNPSASPVLSGSTVNPYDTPASGVYPHCKYGVGGTGAYNSGVGNTGQNGTVIIYY